MAGKSACYLLVLVCFTAFAVSKSEASTVQITYRIWIGDDISQTYKLPLTVPTGSTFYDVMEIASGLNSNFEFEASVHTIYGHYIYRLANHTEKTNDGVYWMLYVLNSCPDPENTPPNSALSDFGVDTLIVQDGKHYLFWYKTFVYEGN